MFLKIYIKYIIVILAKCNFITIKMNLLKTIIVYIQESPT